MSNIYFISIPDRGLVKITGTECRAFLQGLISNNINLLDKQPSVYACLLTPQGKFLHDFFITEMNETIFLDCEGGARAQDLARRLSIYKLRTKVQIECIPENTIYAVLPPHPSSPSSRTPFPHSGKGAVYPDPRHPDMGFRSFTKPENAEEKPFEFYDRHRISLTIPDGSRDMIVEKSTLLECNIDRLNGISWDKGCYMGQELTARMHYRGLVKKRLTTVSLPSIETDIRTTCGDIGLAMLKIAP
jgi:folate-binding protein YgfZ